MMDIVIVSVILALGVAAILFVLAASFIEENDADR